MSENNELNKQNKIKVGNPTLHNLKLSKIASSKYEVLEMPLKNKQKLFVNFEGDLVSQAKEFCKIIAEFVKNNKIDALYCAGHPTIDTAIQAVAKIYGLEVFRPIFEGGKPPIIEEFYQLSVDTILSDRKLRFELEHM